MAALSKWRQFYFCYDDTIFCLMFKIYLLNKILFNTFVETLNITPMSAQDFQTEVISLSKPLKYFALNLTSNDEDAKDLLQETLFIQVSSLYTYFVPCMRYCVT